MHGIEWLVVLIYGMGMIFIFAYSMVQLSLLWIYKRGFRKIEANAAPFSNPVDWPEVLVQLPVYNEQYVVERLIDAACALQYPKDQLQIQVLDDSSDESYELAAIRVRHWQDLGVRITHVRRSDRQGFKAGALQHGLALNLAPFVAIFDADFLPGADFLVHTIPAFTSDDIGMVQTRWEHLNRNFSLLTRVQAFALDAHFTVEQTGRNLGGHFMNFNGTAGVWRRTCIESAGGWSADTLTEDLDLSYRAQMKGWKFRFLERVAAPAELPAEMAALKNQQYRWNKGAAECAVKHLPKVLSNAKLSPGTRLHAIFHLLNSSVFIWIVLCALLSLPLVMIKTRYPEFSGFFHIGALLLVSFGVLALYYYTAWRRVGRKTGHFGWLYPAFLSMSMGMSLHNAIAVLEGYAGKRTPFVRTPKWSISGKAGTWKKKQYASHKAGALVWAEGILTLYFIGALIFGLASGEWGFIPLHAMLVFGFGAVCYYSLEHARS